MAGTTLPGRLSWILADIVGIVVETPRTKTLVIRAPGWHGHLAGQHVDIRLTADDGYQAERSYSIASAPDGEHLELTIERLDDGEVSPYLADELRVGDRLELRGPIGGHFAWTVAEGGPLLLLGGGSGIVPLMAMVRYRAAMGLRIPARLLASYRTAEDIIYGAELARLTSVDDSLQVIFTLTRQQPMDWAGYRRRVDVDMLREVAWTPDERPLAYICGPTPFVEAAATALVRLGHDPLRIRTERFGPTGG